MIGGCLGPEQPQNVTNDTNVTPPPPPPVKTPSFTITSPGEGETVLIQGETGDITLLMGTQNLVLKQPGGMAKNGEGHFKITVDNGNPLTVSTKTYVLSGISVGQHTVKVELYNNDRTAYSPSISQQVTFNVEKETPAEYIPQEYTVSIEDFTYDPAQLTVKVGDSVTWENTGAYPRSATCFINGKQVFDTTVLGPGKSATITMNETMDCEYYSVTHMAMKGHIKVESNGTESG
jgi:plastocyanin